MPPIINTSLILVAGKSLTIIVIKILASATGIIRKKHINRKTIR